MNIVDCWNCNIPTWAAPAIINGDESGLSIEQIESMRAWMNALLVDLEARGQYPLFDITVDDEYFTWLPEFGEPGTCVCLSVTIAEKP